MKLLAVTVSLGAALLVMMTAPSYAAGGDAIFKKSCASCITLTARRRKRPLQTSLPKKDQNYFMPAASFKKPACGVVAGSQADSSHEVQLAHRKEQG